MQRYCRYHDILLCDRHKDDCLGGERCNPKEPTADVAAGDFCSVCAGVILPKAQRSKPSTV